MAFLLHWWTDFTSRVNPARTPYPCGSSINPTLFCGLLRELVVLALNRALPTSQLENIEVRFRTVVGQWEFGSTNASKVRGCHFQICKYNLNTNTPVSNPSGYFHWPEVKIYSEHTACPVRRYVAAIAPQASWLPSSKINHGQNALTSLEHPKLIYLLDQNPINP